MVGGATAILYADHRESRDHDHVVTDLEGGDGVALQLVRKLSDPQPADKNRSSTC
jgi:hypothetical protein